MQTERDGFLACSGEDSLSELLLPHSERRTRVGKSYGFFEIPGVTAAVVALDIMCKTADVEMVTWEKKLGGRLVTIIIRGNVSAVTQAVEAAVTGGIRKPAAYVVIPSPHEEIIKMIESSVNRVS